MSGAHRWRGGLVHRNDGAISFEDALLGLKVVKILRDGS